MLNKLSSILVHEDAITDETNSIVKSVQVATNPLSARLSLIQTDSNVLSPEERCELESKLQTVELPEDMPMDEKQQTILDACTK
jgi:hypothetical protein